MAAFRAQLERLVKQHFSLTRLTGKGIKLARDLERLVNDAPGDTRRVLRRFAEGNLGRVQAPGVEALGDRVSRDLKRLTGAIALAALVVGGSMLEMSPLGGWRGLLSVTMLLTGVFGTLVISLGVLRRRLGQQ
jgi:ubiquinone biosynthesis protein